jgi:hypothetical protein
MNPGLNFEQAIHRLMQIRKQKEELERQEAAIREQLVRQFRDLKEQLEKLGIVDGPPPANQPVNVVPPDPATAPPSVPVPGGS